MITYIVANSYQAAMDYVYKADLSQSDVRFVSCPEVLKGVNHPKVVVLGAAEQVSEGILEALVRHEAEVEYVSQ